MPRVKYAKGTSGRHDAGGKMTAKQRKAAGLKPRKRRKR